MTEQQENIMSNLQKNIELMMEIGPPDFSMMADTSLELQQELRAHPELYLEFMTTDAENKMLGMRVLDTLTQEEFRGIAIALSTGEHAVADALMTRVLTDKYPDLAIARKAAMEKSAAVVRRVSPRIADKLEDLQHFSPRPNNA